MFKVGMVSVTFRRLTPEQIIELVAQTELEGIEWGGDVHVPPGDFAAARRVAALTREAGLEVASYGSYFRLGEQEVAEFAPVLETAQALGAPNVRVWAGRVGSADADEAYHSRVRTDSRRIAEMAAAAGLSVSYEYHRNTLADSLAATQSLLDAVDAPNLATYWQPFPERSIEENARTLRALLPRLSNVHVFHWEGGRRLPLAAGESAWREYLSVIAGASRERWALLEFVLEDDPERFRQDAATLVAWRRALTAGAGSD